MNKRLTLGILLTNWLVCLCLVFSLPNSLEAASSTDSKAQLQQSKSLFSETFNLSETSSHEINFEGFILPQRGNPSLVNSDVKVVPISFSEYSTIPFFDVKQTFIHFFHTW
jgi:hypothetical protein